MATKLEKLAKISHDSAFRCYNTKPGISNVANVAVSLKLTADWPMLPVATLPIIVFQQKIGYNSAYRKDAKANNIAPNGLFRFCSLTVL